MISGSVLQLWKFFVFVEVFCDWWKCFVFVEVFCDWWKGFVIVEVLSDWWKGFVFVEVFCPYEPRTKTLFAFSKTYSLSKKVVKIFFVILFFRITSPGIITSSDVQIHPLRIDIDLLRFCSHGSRVFLTGQVFFGWFPKMSFKPFECPGSMFTWSTPKML